MNLFYLYCFVLFYCTIVFLAKAAVYSRLKRLLISYTLTYRLSVYNTAGFPILVNENVITQLSHYNNKGHS